MFHVNENYQKLPGSYLFSTIAKKVNAGLVEVAQMILSLLQEG